jgi:hypothetical protein
VSEKSFVEPLQELEATLLDKTAALQAKTAQSEAATNAKQVIRDRYGEADLGDPDVKTW